MTDAQLDRFIQQANTGKGRAIMFKRPMGGNVDEARFITIKPKPTDLIRGGEQVAYRAYLIKNDSGEYAGIVLDMSQDLHWYVAPKHRGKGLMKAALLDYILPWLCYNEGRDTQRITIDRSILHYEASKAIALAVGFKMSNQINGSDEFILDMDFEPDYESIPVTMTTERVEEIKREVHYYAKKLKMIYAECEMCLTDIYGLDRKFDDLISNTSALGYWIQDKRLDLIDEENEKSK